jgi:hypothetical protein
LKGHFFELGLVNSSVCERCHNNEETIACPKPGLTNLRHVFPKRHARIFFLVLDCHCCVNFSSSQPCYIMTNTFTNIYIYIYIFLYEGAEIVYDYHCYRLMLRVNSSFYTNQKRWPKQHFLRILSTVLFSLSPCNKFYNNNNTI